MELYTIAHTLHNPSERHLQMSSWITRNRNLCSSQDLVVIWNNLSEWAGSADSAEIRQKVIYAYQEALKRETPK